MNGRHFSGMVIEAYIATGGEKFKKTNEKKAEFEESDAGEGKDGEDVDEDEDEEGRRLEGFGKWLEEEDEQEGKFKMGGNG